MTQGYSIDQTGPVSTGPRVGLMTSAQAYTDTVTREAMWAAGHNGLVTITRISADGSFQFSGYEWAVAAFAREMKKRGYNMGWLGEESTPNFAGSREPEDISAP